MQGDTLLLGIAQIAVVIAGFTAVTSALTPPGGSWSPGQRIRQRAIVTTSFNVTFESLLPLIAFAWLGDAREALVLASGIVAVYVSLVVSVRFRQFVMAKSIRTRGVLLLMAVSLTAAALFVANAVAFGSVAAYSLALCCQLSVSVISFYSLVAAASS